MVQIQNDGFFGYKEAEFQSEVPVPILKSVFLYFDTARIILSDVFNKTQLAASPSHQTCCVRMT